MLDTVVDLARDALTSPWGYLALFAFSALDAFLPIVPSESLVITAGVFAAGGEPDLLGVIAASTAGALAGDHVSYAIGRTARGRLRGRRAVEWAQRTLAERGGLVLVVARYIPGGRTAATLTMGAVAYPLRTFSAFDFAAALSWGTYAAMVGYLGGSAFEDDPLMGLLLGFGVATLLAVTIEVVRRARRRPRTR